MQTSTLLADSGRTILWTSCRQGIGEDHAMLYRLFPVLGRMQLYWSQARDSHIIPQTSGNISHEAFFFKPQKNILCIGEKVKRKIKITFTEEHCPILDLNSQIYEFPIAPWPSSGTADKYCKVLPSGPPAVLHWYPSAATSEHWWRTAWVCSCLSIPDCPSSPRPSPKLALHHQWQAKITI